MSVEAQKIEKKILKVLAHHLPPLTLEFSLVYWSIAKGGKGEGGGQEQAKNGYFKMPLFVRGSGKPLYFKKNDSNKSPRRR